VREGAIRREDSVVAVLTGHVLKDPGVVMEFHARAGRHRNPPVTIEGRLPEVEALLKRR
jgi:threonine synthase